MYLELHASSAFSFLDGASLPEALVERAAELGYPALALLDRDGVYGIPRFHLAARRAGIRAIVGAELTLAGAGGRGPGAGARGSGYGSGPRDSEICDRTTGPRPSPEPRVPSPEPRPPSPEPRVPALSPARPRRLARGVSESLPARHGHEAEGAERRRRPHARRSRRAGERPRGAGWPHGHQRAAVWCRRTRRSSGRNLRTEERLHRVAAPPAA